MPAAMYPGPTLMYGPILGVKTPTYTCLNSKMNHHLRLQSAVRDLAILQNAQKGARINVQVALCADVFRRDWGFGSQLIAWASRFGANFMDKGMCLVLELGPEVGFFWRNDCAVASVKQLQENGVRFALRAPNGWAKQSEVLTWIKAEGCSILESVLIPHQDLLREEKTLSQLFERELPVIATGVTHVSQPAALAAHGYQQWSGPLAGIVSVDEITDQLQRECSSVRRFSIRHQVAKVV